MRFVTWGFVLLACANVVCLAEDAGVTTVIDPGRIINPRDGRVLERHSIVVRGNRIVAIQPSDEPAPTGAKRIAIPDLTLLPGLFDVHTHLLYQHDLRLGFNNQHFLEQIVQWGTVKRALFGVKTAREMLETGFTSVRDLGNSGHNGDIALRDASAQNWTAGPRMMVSTRAIALAGGQFEFLPPESRSIVAQEYAEVGTTEEAVKAVRQAFFEGADCIKLIIDSGLRVMPQEMIQAVVSEVRRIERMGFGRRPVAAHAISDLAVRSALEAGVDSVEHGYGASEATMRLMAQKKVYLILTEDSYDGDQIAHINRVVAFWNGSPMASAEVQKEGQPDWRAVSRKRIAQAFALGVPIAFGSDCYGLIPGQTRGDRAILSLVALAEAGIPNLRVLQAATSVAADLLGWEQRTGSLTPGLLADMIGVEGNPLDDIKALRRARFVMKDGAVVRQP